MRRKISKLPAVMPKTYSELCMLHLPRRINDHAGFDNTVEVVHRLATMGRLTPDQDEYLDTLSILIEQYDREHFSRDSIPLDPIKMLLQLMEWHDMSASDLGRLLGNRSLGPAILRGERKISKANAVKLGERFKMQPSAFIQF